MSTAHNEGPQSHKEGVNHCAAGHGISSAARGFVYSNTKTERLLLIFL